MRFAWRAFSVCVDAMILCLITGTLAWAQVGNIRTISGNGTAGFAGDGGPATAAAMKFPWIGIAVDIQGSIFISEAGNNRIRRVDASTGEISSIAGNGSAGFSGDGGAATDASLNAPRGVAVDTRGNIYISDSGNNRIRRVDANTGLISTIAGNGVAGYTGDGGTATDAQINSPIGVKVDLALNVFISDSNNSRIRRVEFATGIITTVAGNGSAGYNGDGQAATNASLAFPADIALDHAGNLYISDENNYRIRRVDVNTGAISTIAGTGVFGSSGDGGPATGAMNEGPAGITLDDAGDIFFADANVNRVRKVDLQSGIITSFAGTGAPGYNGDDQPPTSATLNGPLGVTFDHLGNLYVTDTFNNRVREIPSAGPFPILELSATALSFGNQQVGTNSPEQVVTLTNTGTATLFIDSVSSTAFFGVNQNCVGNPVPPNGSCVVKVQFSPTIAGTVSGIGDIETTAAGRSQFVTLTGNGVSDIVPPKIVCGTSDGQWHASDISILCSATDDGSGLANPSDGSFPLSTSTAAGQEFVNVATGSHVVCDAVGNCAVAGPISGNMIDKKGPIISLSAPISGTYTIRQIVPASYSCEDGGSGVKSCVGTVPSGANVNTSSAGVSAFAVNALDNVGNPSISTLNYTVVYTVCPLYDSSKASKSGSTIPIKLAICGANSEDVSSSAVSLHAIGVTQLSTSASTDVIDAGNANPDADFRFDATLGSAGGYIFNLQTTGLTVGTYSLVFRAGSDPTLHNAYFQVR